MFVNHFVRSRETGIITTPTVKARFNRLVNVGYIKAVSPILDFDIVEENIKKPEVWNKNNEDFEAIKSLEAEMKKNNKKKKSRARSQD
jgi:hypothetical protein